MPESNTKVLCFFPHTFPYGYEEYSFIRHEIELLATEFDQVYIFPRRIPEKPQTIMNLPVNVTVIHHPIYEPYNRIRTFVSNFPLVVRIMWTQLYLTNERWFYIKDLIGMLNFLLLRIDNAVRLRVLIRQNNLKDAIFYSYWFSTAVEFLTILKQMGEINYVVTRAHGGDLYKYQKGLTDFYFRSYQMTQLQLVAPISLSGFDYMKSEYPEQAHKIQPFKLGVPDQPLATIPLQDSPIRVVSCSSVIPLKRVHLIAELVRHLNRPCVWTHIGDGSEMESLKQAIQSMPSDTQVDFVGKLDHDEVIKFYRLNAVDFVINTSESEGLPVALMEAISFGIPVVGTDVGGISEIVCDQTGVLIAKDFDPGDVANQIEQKIPLFRTEIFRKGVKQFFAENFDSHKNHTAFIKMLKACAA